MPSTTIYPALNQPGKRQARPPLAEPEHEHDRDYPKFLETIRLRMLAVTAELDPLFTTDATGLFELYLKSLPEKLRQQHNCRTCASFLNRYGGLAYVTPEGVLVPALWGLSGGVLNLEGTIYNKAAKALSERVKYAKITGLFLTDAPLLGKPTTGPWSHLHFCVRDSHPAIWRDKIKDVGQRIAEKGEDYRTVRRAVATYEAKHLDTAITYLKTTLARGEKFVAPTKWLLDLIAKTSGGSYSDVTDNIVWRAVAQAPDGFCHFRGSVVGTLLEDIQAGLGLDAIAKRWSEKLDPLQYMRPQATPAEGNIRRAEEIIAKLGLTDALRRRWATLRECILTWAPSSDEPGLPPKINETRIFNHLRAPPRGAAPVTMTGVKFFRDILPEAKRIWLINDRVTYPFGAFTTAVFQTAPRILAWDDEHVRNPVAWYTYRFHTTPNTWGLYNRDKIEVLGVSERPSAWHRHGNFPGIPQGDAFLLILKGARDTRTPGLALFPECLRPELREVRATIEAHSKAMKLESPEPGTQHAAGLLMGASDPNLGEGLLFEVHLGGSLVRYRIDRWE